MKRLVPSIIGFFVLSAAAGAGYREDFEKEFLTKPWAGQQAESTCLECHSTKPSADDNVALHWRRTIHYENKVSCHDCHGGDPKDASMAMTHTRGFVGKPKAADVPEFCGKCHIRVLNNYRESGHGKALLSTGKGPNCVTCHGAHIKGRYTQKASIDIINESLCTQCHSYERAKAMKQALFLVEKKIQEVDVMLEALKKAGIYPDDEEKVLFNTHAEFRALSHTVDVTRVKNSTDTYLQRLDTLEQKARSVFAELQFRRNYSAFLMLLFVGMGIVVFMFTRPPKE